MAVERLLLESGDYLLLETGDRLLLESSTPGGTAYTLACDAGAFSISGQDATLVYTPGATPTAYSLNCEAGSFVISGQAANLVWSGANRQQVIGGGGWLPARKRTKKEIDEERRRLGILPPEVVEAVAAVKPERRKITLAQLIGKEQAARITSVDLSEAVAMSKRRKRQRDDELLLLM